MTEETHTPPIQISGHLAWRLASGPLRVLAIISGFVLVRALLALFARYLLGFRRAATATIENRVITVDEEWTLFGKTIRKARTSAPIADLKAVRIEDRKRYVYLLIGFGCLATGVWVGIQFLVDGLNAGYPFLTLIGAGVVLLGVILDVVLYVFVPEGNGASRVSLTLGKSHLRLCGAERDAADRFQQASVKGWQSNA